MLVFAAMRTLALALAVLGIAACGGESEAPAGPQIAKEPVSVRGWIADVEGAAPTGERTIETEIARRVQLFQSTNVWVENIPFVSGGVSEGGAFLLLDVPPGDVTISFAAPGAENAQLVLQNIPGNADVLVPGIMLRKGGVSVIDPKAIVVRVPARVDKPEPTGTTALVAGQPVAVIRAPYALFNDRRDYPEPGGVRAVATFK